MFLGRELDPALLPAGMPANMPDQAWNVLETLFPESSGRRIELFSNHDRLQSRPGWRHVAYQDMADVPKLCNELVNHESGKLYDMSGW